MSQDQALVFDITPQELSVVISGKDYILREASGHAAAQYRNSALKSFKMGAEGNPETIIDDGLVMAEPLLVSLCLFQKTDKGLREVSLETVLGWPNKIIKPLFEKAKEISDLGEGEETLENLKQDKEAIDKKIAEIKEKEEVRKNS